MSEESASLEKAAWQPIPEAADESSSSEDVSPYHGYVQLEGDGSDRAEVADEELLVPTDDADVAEMWPAPSLAAMSSKFLPRGTPTSVLAAEVEDEGPMELAGGFDVDAVDFAEVSRVMARIKLKALDKSE